MSGNRSGGLKAAAKTRELYGEETIRQWGRDGIKARKSDNHAFRDMPGLAARAGAIGGVRGHRHRTITKNTKLKSDEWGLLLKYSNRAAGRIRLEDKGLDAIEQHNIYHAIFDFWEKEDWVSAVTEVCSHPDYYATLLEVINDEYVAYSERVVNQPRRSPDKEYLRIIRNVKAAVESLKE